MLQMNNTVSPGLWMLAWRRLRADRVAMAALSVVGLFLAMLAASMGGLLAADWEEEVAVNYAPPSFVGADPALAALAQPQRPRLRERECSRTRGRCDSSTRSCATPSRRRCPRVSGSASTVAPPSSWPGQAPRRRRSPCTSS